MNLASRSLVLILISLTLLIGFFVTFSLISGKMKYSDIFTKIETGMDWYLWLGIFILIGIFFFGIFLSLKQRILHTS
jgi:hypothetical protein